MSEEVFNVLKDGLTGVLQMAQKTVRPKKQRIIFLDIDGPMIPDYCYLMYGQMASFNRNFSPVSVSIINKLCHRTRAKIVFNSYHNWMHIRDLSISEGKPIPDLLHLSVKRGIKSGHILGRTLFSHPEHHTQRLQSCIDWVDTYQKQTGKTVEWIVFDDESLPDSRACLVDPVNGLTTEHYHWACEKFGKGANHYGF